MLNANLITSVESGLQGTGAIAVRLLEQTAASCGFDERAAARMLDESQRVDGEE